MEEKRAAISEFIRLADKIQRNHRWKMHRIRRQQERLDAAIARLKRKLNEHDRV